MPRPKKTRFVSTYPGISAFVPRGASVTCEIFMSVEELESIRLSDFKRLDQETAANMMKVSRHTYGRILANARSVVAEALVAGKTLKIGGGAYELCGMGEHRHKRCGKKHGKEVSNMPQKDKTGPQGQGPKTGQGRGRCGVNSGNSVSESQDDMETGRGQRTGRGTGRGQGKGRGARQGRCNRQ